MVLSHHTLILSVQPHYLDGGGRGVPSHLERRPHSLPPCLFAAMTFGSVNAADSGSTCHCLLGLSESAFQPEDGDSAGWRMCVVRCLSGNQWSLLLPKTGTSWSQWSRSVRRRSAATWLLGSRGRIPLGHGCLSVVLSCVGRGLCDGPITGPEESYRVSVCVIRETPKGALCSKLGTTGKWTKTGTSGHTGKFLSFLLPAKTSPQGLPTVLLRVAFWTVYYYRVRV
jgi:hypothetical protein